MKRKITFEDIEKLCGWPPLFFRKQYPGPGYEFCTGGLGGPHIKVIKRVRNLREAEEWITKRYIDQ